MGLHQQLVRGLQPSIYGGVTPKELQAQCRAKVFVSKAFVRTPRMESSGWKTHSKRPTGVLRQSS
eukprot:10940661-Heterocapsa_arctica.AAC.1